MSDLDPTLRSWHDMGGQPAGRIDRSTHDYELWEKRVDALLVLTSNRGLFTVDGLRRALEELGPEAFESMTYYERWIAAVTQNLVEAGVITEAELEARIQAVMARGDTYGEVAGVGE